ncbi:hypothetical protein HCN44_009985 [Aphidius gifuensis]|uniref:Uncharacterized protein n=1 Tax=Aphidius gifuensis TaxID=684658 RepID=A0A835CTL4_APHGI|nr:hypothetical protein HCN44_009985 [Aphidius gifuensis]
MDSSDDDNDDESKAKLLHTPSKRKPKNDRTPKKKLKTEQAGGSRNIYSFRAGRYVRSSIKISSSRQTSAGAKKFAGQKNRREQTIQMGLRTLLNITKETKNNDLNKKVYDKVISEVRVMSKWRIASSMFFEFCFNHENNWLLNDIMERKVDKSIDDVFNIMRLDSTRVNHPDGLKELHQEWCSFIEENNLEIETKFDTKGLFRLTADAIKKFTKNNIDFAVVPIHKFGWLHIRYSASALEEFVKNLNLAPKIYKETINCNNAELWEKIFNIKKHTSLGKNFYETLTTNGAEISIFCLKPKTPVSTLISENEINIGKVINDDNVVKLPKIQILSKHKLNDIKKQKPKRYASFDPGFRCPLAGIFFNNLEDLNDKDKQRRYCLKHSTYLYKTGFYRSEKIRKKLTRNADKKIEDLMKSSEFKDINLKNSFDYKRILKFRLLSYEAMQPVYGDLKLTKIRWN